MTLQQGWDSEASNWVQAARTPGFDYAYETINRPAMISLLPPSGHRTLELGCGEGRVSRLIRDLGHQVVGVDGSPAMVGYALTHPDGAPAVAAEAARVLIPSGRLYLAITHPTSTAGSFQGGEPDAPFVITGSYLDPFRSAVRLDRGDINLTFHSEHRPLAAYSAALEAAGLLIEKLREVPASATAIERDPRNLRWLRVPMFLHLVAVKPG